MIIDPVFFSEEDWVQQPTDWPPNVVSGMTYDLAQGEGKRVLDECQARALALRRTSPESRVGTPPLR